MPLAPGTLPDPDLHSVCRRCQMWTDRADGSAVLPAANSVFQQSLQAAKIIGGQNISQFVCFRCQRRAKMRFRVLAGIGIVVMLIVLALEKCGLLK